MTEAQKFYLTCTHDSMAERIKAPIPVEMKDELTVINNIQTAIWRTTFYFKNKAIGKSDWKNRTILKVEYAKLKMLINEYETLYGKYEINSVSDLKNIGLNEDYSPIERKP